MKILLVGDPHLQMSTFQQSIDLLKWIESVAEEHKPDVVCNLGDTFHNHAVLRVELLKEFQDHVLRVTQNLNTEYWYVLGNHDQYSNKSSKYHALQLFKYIPKLTIFDSRVDIGDISIVPYVHNPEDFPKQTKRICITHNTFRGVDYGFKIENEGIAAEDISAETIISGHVHKKQEFGKVFYPGTPIAHSASDVNQDKGLTIYDTATGEQLFIESPFPKWKSKEFTITQDSNISDLTDMVSKLNTTDKWILKVTGPKVELAAYFKSKAYINAAKGKNIVTKSVPTDSNKSKIQIKATSLEDIVSEYVEKVYDGGLDKQLILKKALEIIGNNR